MRHIRCKCCTISISGQWYPGLTIPSRDLKYQLSAEQWAHILDFSWIKNLFISIVVSSILDQLYQLSSTSLVHRVVGT